MGGCACGAVDWCPLFSSTAAAVAPVVPDGVNVCDAERAHNAYDVNEDVERKRLVFQRNLTKDIDVDVLRGLLPKSNVPLNILDVGCNDGALLRDRLHALGITCRAVGVDIDAEIVKKAREGFPEMKAVCADCESDDFLTQFYENVPAGVQFDAAIVSMVLLHMKNPVRVLRNVRNLLRKDGVIYIRDMDDGTSVAYPDDKGTFKRILQICNDVKYTGYRHSGREIYGLLQQAGFTAIKSVPCVVDVTCAEKYDYDFRENLFQVNFGFLIGDAKLAAMDDVNVFGADYAWLKDTGMQQLNDMFHSAEFYYRMGLVAFTAKK